MDAELRTWLDRLIGSRLVENGGEWSEFDDEVCRADRATFERLAQIFENPAVWLAPYSEESIAQAFWDLSSEVFCELGRDPVDWDLHMRVFRSFEVLFRELFAVRCTLELGHLSQGGPLNGICYMWWDLYCWDFIPRDIFLSMIRTILAIEHVACQESALHGLGHMRKVLDPNPEVEAIIDDFLGQHPNLRPELREYALRARTGIVR
jgi:hypothetical protein